MYYELKQGDVVVCVNNGAIASEGIMDMSHRLTTGKEYIVGRDSPTDSNTIFITDDKGEGRSSYKVRFKLKTSKDMKKIVGYKPPYTIRMGIPTSMMFVEGASGYVAQGKLGAGEQWFFEKEFVEKLFIPIYEEEKIIFDRYEAVVETNGSDVMIAFGCQKFTKEKLEGIKQLLGKEVGATITVKGVILTAQLIDKLINKLPK